MASVFWDVRGIIFIDYLEKGNTINREYYITLLEGLKDEISNKRPAFLTSQKILVGKKFRSNEEIIAETEAYFEAKNKSFYKSGIEMLERRWNDCVALDGDYIDK